MLKSFEYQRDIQTIVALEKEIFADDPFLRHQLYFLHKKYDLGKSIVIIDSNEIIGYLLGAIEGNFFHIYSLGVVSSKRRNGYGSHMVKHLLGQLKRLKLDGILLEVRSSNNAAIGFYRNLGFVEVSISLSYYPDGEDAKLMMYTK